jgi:ribosome modulation factor
MPLNQDPRSWEEGYQAGATADRAVCPYPAESLKAWSWHSGWLEGAARPRQTPASSAE